MSNVNAEELKDLEVPLPLIARQKEVFREYSTDLQDRDQILALASELMGSVDAYVLNALQISPQGESRRVFAVTRAATKKRLDADFNSPQFEVLRRSIARSTYGSADLRDVVLSIRSGFAAGSKDQARDGVLSLPHLRPLNLNRYGELTLVGTKSVPRQSVSETDLIAQGEVLFNNTNSAEWVGKTAVFDLDVECACSNHMTRIIPTDSLDPYYLAALLNSLRGLGYFKALSTYFNYQAGINAATLGDLRIPVPPIEVQREIAKEVQDRKLKARDFQDEASKMWQAARQRFEDQLLNGVAR
jgi:type I restriction enzyme S subunit